MAAGAAEHSNIPTLAVVLLFATTAVTLSLSWAVVQARQLGRWPVHTVRGGMLS